MKKIVVFVTAMSAMAPAAVFAQATGMLTEAETVEVMGFVPDADLSSLTAEQATAITAALESDKNEAGQIKAILAEGTMPDPALVDPDSGMLTEAELAEAKTYVPEGDYANLTSEQANAISAALSGGGENISGQITTILGVETMPDPALADPNSGMLTEAEMAEAKTYAPDADLSNLTSEQANAISAALSSGSDVAGQINSILMQ